jgi:hypothetical protein
MSKPQLAIAPEDLINGALRRVRVSCSLLYPIMCGRKILLERAAKFFENWLFNRIA